MHILDIASPNDNPDTALLAACARVSRAWCFVAQKRLFSRVALTCAEDAEVFCTTVDPKTPREEIWVIGHVRNCGPGSGSNCAKHPGVRNGALLGESSNVQ